MSALAKFLLLRPKGVNLIAFLRSFATYFGTWPGQELTGLVSLADNVAVALGRDVALNTYADYTAGANWSNPGTEVARHAAGAVATLQQDGILAAGKTWQATITVSNRTAGSVTITDGGAAISGNGEVTRTIASTGADFIITPTNDFDGDIDVAILLVQQTDILDSSAGLGLLDGTYSGVTLAQEGAGRIPYMVSYDGATSFNDIYSAELNSAFNPDAGTLIVAARVANAGVWTDGAARRLITLLADASNYMFVEKSSGNAMRVLYNASGTLEIITMGAISDLDMFTISVTWDKSGAGLRLYYNATQQGAAVAIAGTWVGNLASTQTVIGALNTTPNNVWHGDLAYSPILFTSALTPTEIAQITAVFGVS